MASSTYSGIRYSAEDRNVIEPFAQWRRADDIHGQAVVQVFAKLMGAGHFRQVPVGRNDKAEVDGYWPLPADSIDFAGFQYTEQFRLSDQTEFAHFIEQKCSAIGLFEAALPELGIGEGALFAAEKLGFDQRFRQARAIHADERPAGAVALHVDLAGNQLFARSSLALNQYRHICRRRDSNVGAQSFERFAGADQRPVIRQ